MYKKNIDKLKFVIPLINIHKFEYYMYNIKLTYFTKKNMYNLF